MSQEPRTTEQQTRARIALVARTLRQAAYDKHRETLFELSKVRATVSAEDNAFDALVPIQVRDACVVADILDVMTRSPRGVVEQVAIAVAIAKIDELEQQLATAHECLDGNRKEVTRLSRMVDDLAKDRAAADTEAEKLRKQLAAVDRAYV